MEKVPVANVVRVGVSNDQHVYASCPVYFLDLGLPYPGIYQNGLVSRQKEPVTRRESPPIFAGDEVDVIAEL
jgi:hypothetical protein